MNKKIITLAVALPLILTAFTSCGADMDVSYIQSNSNNFLPNDIEGGVEYAAEDAIPDYSIPSDEEYREFIESGFKDPTVEPLSTFSADVDTASYSNARRFISNSTRVPEDSVRIEEFINYFDYDYADPPENEKFGQYIELAECPWNPDSKLMMCGIQGERMKKSDTPPSNLVFLIDSSGSMNTYDKLPLVQQAFSMLAENLTKDDRISIVTYAGTSEIVLEGATGADKDDIIDALYSLRASGSTNGEGGINDAYAIAEKYFIEGGNNRVILATDGDLNVGLSSEEELTDLIEAKRDNGVYISVLGFGTGNYKDARLEAVADHGNGNYSYIDSVEEAGRVLVEEMSGTLFTIAKDVKIQVEFNPAQVKSYRLIGYDNRLMDAEDFYDETKDAGEVGAGHSVTALYEIQLVADEGKYHGVQLEFAETPTEAETEDARPELCNFKITYKDIETGEDVYKSKLFGMEHYNETPSDKISLAGAVAEYAMLLKNSEYKGSSDFDYVISTAQRIADNTENEHIKEFAGLASSAKELY